MAMLEGRSALVTGAGSGVGRAVAQALASEGCAVALCSRNQDQLSQTARMINESGGQATFLPADIRDEAALQAVVDLATGAYGSLDLVVANAGMDRVAGLDGSPKDWQETLETNVVGSLLTARVALGAMPEGARGDLVFVSSLVVREGDPENPVYVGSKQALETGIDALRRKLQGTGVRVTVVRPGIVATNMARWHSQAHLEDLARRLGLDPDAIGVRHGEPLPQEMHDKIRTLRGRILLPEDVASAVLFAVTRPDGVQVDAIDLRAEGSLDD